WPGPLVFLAFLAMSSLLVRCPPCSPLFPYTTLFRSRRLTPATPPSSSSTACACCAAAGCVSCCAATARGGSASPRCRTPPGDDRSEEHTSELQSRENLVCRLLLEKKR